MKGAHLRVVPVAASEIPFQSASLDIWDKKYRLKSKDGTIIDQSIDGTYKRIARALADVEETGKNANTGMKNSCGHCAMA